MTTVDLQLDRCPEMVRRRRSLVPHAVATPQFVTATQSGSSTVSTSR
ncbi:unnamed protein product [Acanthoscelides obtectus]|uniref:Uncharacterized protein n=1 Tax=Acanthoscelides obtectus TaxID=200917 RepID=A0A9P0PYR5_ACAOB|nr:unnamed protein product [Acanthoscelides obtectus]CAK1665952.1 hypothetical protein AOBTE_LOCUS25069 [Acanthoscelides obtectus]